MAVAITRYSITIKAADSPSKRPTVIYFYVPAVTSEAVAITTANKIAALNNGTVTGISKQVYHNASADAVGFAGASARANNGSSFNRLTLKNDVGQTDQLQLPLQKHVLEDEEIETALEAAGEGEADLYNRFGELLGQVVAQKKSQVIDGT